ncbi:MAG: RNA polymerase sigma factor ShbA [Sciscionella sp.]
MKSPNYQPNPSSLALQEWVEPAARGDQDALTRLLALLRPMIVRYCQARMTRWEVDIVTADDVAQEVCLAVCKSLPRYRYDNQFFLGYVYGIAAHKITDVRRAAVRRRTQPLPQTPEAIDENPGPENCAIFSEQRARLFSLLDTLSPEHRMVLMLRIVRGLSAQETAEAIGSTAGAVRVAQHRALTKLRAAFASPSASQELISSLRMTA